MEVTSGIIWVTSSSSQKQTLSCVSSTTMFFQRLILFELNFTRAITFYFLFLWYQLIHIEQQRGHKIIILVCNILFELSIQRFEYLDLLSKLRNSGFLNILSPDFPKYCALLKADYVRFFSKYNHFVWNTNVLFQLYIQGNLIKSELLNLGFQSAYDSCWYFDTGRIENIGKKSKPRLFGTIHNWLVNWVKTDLTYLPSSSLNQFQLYSLSCETCVMYLYIWGCI